VSFFHHNFKKDRPDLLQSIKRATKSEQQTKEENDSLREEIASLRSTMAAMQAETNDKIAVLTEQFNQKIAALQGENRALLMTMQPFIGGAASAASAAVPVAPPLATADVGSSNLMQSLGAVATAAMSGMKRTSTEVDNSNGNPASKKSRQ